MLDRVRVNKSSHTTVNKIPPAAFNFTRKLEDSQVLLMEPKDLLFATTHGVSPYDKEAIYTEWWYDNLSREARRTKTTYYTMPIKIIQVAAPSDSRQLGKRDLLLVEATTDPFKRCPRDRAPKEVQHISQLCFDQEDFDERFANTEAKDE